MGIGHDKLVRELVMVQSSGHKHVGLMPDVYKVYVGLDKRWRSKLERHFRNFGIPGTTMPKEHFNSEGRHPTGGKQSKEVQVCAFKAFQHRIYGVVVGIKNVETFVGLKIVEDKKRDRADQELLKRIAQNIGPYLD